MRMKLRMTNLNQLADQASKVADSVTKSVELRGGGTNSSSKEAALKFNTSFDQQYNPTPTPTTLMGGRDHSDDLEDMINQHYRGDTEDATNSNHEQ